MFSIFPEPTKDLPITIADTLFLKAYAGVSTRAWSQLAFIPGNLIPGVTMKKFLYFFLIIFASRAEQTQPAAPLFLIKAACFKTNFSTVSL